MASDPFGPGSGYAQGPLNAIDYYGERLYNSGNDNPWGPLNDPRSYKYLPMYVGDPMDPYNGQYDAQVKKMAQLQFGLSDDWISTPLGQQDLAMAEQVIRNQLQSGDARRRLPGPGDIPMSTQPMPSPSYSMTPTSPAQPPQTFVGSNWRQMLSNLTQGKTPTQTTNSVSQVAAMMPGSNRNILLRESAQQPQPTIGEPYRVNVGANGQPTPGYTPSKNPSTNTFVNWLAANPYGLPIYQGGDPFNRQNYSQTFSDAQKTQLRDFLDQYASDVPKLQEMSNLIARNPMTAGENFTDYLKQIQQEADALQAQY